MIDILDGTLILDGEHKIGRNLSKTTFLGLDISKDFQILVKNPPWYTYGSIDFRICDIPFGINLSFYDEQLKKITFGIREPKYGVTWKDYSVEKEMERKIRHEEWLEKILGKQKEFPWGKVSSFFDEKLGRSLMAIDYT